MRRWTAGSVYVSVVVSLLHSLRFLVRSRATLHLEILALRYQLAVTTRSRRRRGFRLFWTWKSRHRTGRPAVPHDVRALIREMSRANPFWGAPRTTPRSRFGLYGRRDHDRRDEHARDSNGTALAVAERLRSASLARSDGSHWCLHGTPLPSYSIFDSHRLRRGIVAQANIYG
jgi:hypothetical protein